MYALVSTEPQAQTIQVPLAPSIRVTVSVGPGAHSNDLIELLARRNAVKRVIYSWPSLFVHDFNSDTKRLERSRESSFFRHFVHATWAVWRRIPYWKKYQTPQPFIFSLYDKLASRMLRDPDIFLGWSQVSLVSLREAKRRGAVAVLEHAMMHVDAWQAVMSEEYARFGKGAKRLNSHLSSKMVRRMKAEYDEADYIVVPSTAAEQSFIEHGVPKEKIIRIPLGIDASMFHPAESLGSSPFRVLFVGRLELLKGVHYLLQACSELKLADAELWLAGPVLPEIKPFLARYGGPQVRVIGEVPREQLPEYYRRCHALVFPSLCDGFGLVMLEAMASGLPVIATENSGARDVIKDGAGGFIIPIRDVETMKQRVLWLYRNRAEAEEIGARGRQTILRQFTLKHYDGRVSHVYSTLRDQDHAFSDQVAVRT